MFSGGGGGVDHLSIRACACACECNAFIPRLPPPQSHTPPNPPTPRHPHPHTHSLNFAIQGINYSYADLQRGSTLLSHVMGVLDAAPAALETPAGGYVNPGAIRCVFGWGGLVGWMVKLGEEALTDVWSGLVWFTPCCWNHRGEVEFKDLHFAYPMRPDVPVLRSVRFCF